MKTLLCSFLLAISSLSAYAQVDLNDQLVAWYPFDGTVTDASGNGFDGQAANVASVANRSGEPGKALSFNGTNSQIFIPGGFSDLALPVSFAGWLNKSSAFPSSLTAVFSSSDSPTQYTGFFVSFDALGRVSMQYGDGGEPGVASRKGVSGISAFPEDQWVHVVATIISETEMALYIDGQPVPFDIIGEGGSAMVNSAFDAKFGNYELGVGASPFAGSMDDVRIYSRALNALEVLALYQESTTEPAEARIIISEIMVNPEVVQDNDGEWFEIVNAGEEAVDLSRWILRDDSDDYFVLSAFNPLVIEPAQIMVLCIEDNQVLNGDLVCDYRYGGMQLDRVIDQVILEDPDGNVIDRVDYNLEASFPAAAGVSMFFTGTADDDNNDASFWELAFERSGNYQNDVCALCNDLGSPGIVYNPFLPVELVAFDGLVDGTTVHLDWSTASETNNAGFEVQKKHASGDFATIGWEPGAGTTANAVSYRFSVANLAPGSHTFRLKQIDFDGSFELSDEVELSIESESGYFVGAPYPNPFNPTTRLSFSVDQAQPVRVEVFDMLGRRVMTVFDAHLEAGQVEDRPIDASALPGGTYIVRISGSSFQETRSIHLLK